MKTKNKLIIAIASFALVLIAVVVAVVAVLAAQNVTIKSNINVSYNAGEHVYGSITATVKKPGATEYTTWDSITLDDDSNGTGDFKGLSNSDVALTKTAKSFSMKFEVKKSSALAEDFIATLSYDGSQTIKNMNVTVTIDGTSQSINGNKLVDEITINSTTATEIIVTVEIADTNADATFEANLEWFLENPAD